MKSSSLRKASLSATDFQLSHFPCKNKALADENADLRAKVAQLLHEKEKWQIKYCNLNMKISDFANYRKDVKNLLKRMSFYLQNFLVVRDMLVHMLQQETDCEEVKDNTKAKREAEPEQVSKDRNKQLMREEEHQQQKQQQHQQQQQDIPQNQSQNTTVNPILQSSSVHNQKQSKEIPQHNQLIDFDHYSQQNKVWPVSAAKSLWNVDQEEMLTNEAMQKSCLSNKVLDHQGVCVSSGNDDLTQCSGFQNKFHRNGQHEQLLKNNEKNVSLHQLQECCSLECECLIPDSQQHVHGQLPQGQNMSHESNLKWNLPQNHLCTLQQTAPQNCYPSQQSLIKGQEEPVPDQFDWENNCKAHKQRNIHIREMKQQVSEEQKLENKGQQTLESETKRQYYKGVHQQHEDLQGKLQTEHGPLNTAIQRQKSSVAQRSSYSDVQGQIIADKAQQLIGDQSVLVTINQEIKLTAASGETLRNKALQFIQDVEHPLTSDRKQVNTIENREQVNIHKALQTVEEEEEEEEEEKKKSLKSGEYLASTNDKLHSMGRHEGLTGNQETSVRIKQQLPVKMSQLLPASLHGKLSFSQGQKHYQDKGKLQSSESKLQLSPKDKELPMVQWEKYIECEEQHIVKQLGENQGQGHNIKEQQLTSMKLQRQKKFPPSFAYMKDSQSHCTEKRDYSSVKRDQGFTADQEHQSRNNKENGMANNQELYTTTDHQQQFVTDQQQCPLSNKLQPAVGNKSQKLTNRLMDIVVSDNKMNWKTKNDNEFHKEKGLVPNRDQRRQFEQQVQKIMKKMPSNEQNLSPKQPIVKQGWQQQIINKDQQQKGGKAHEPKEEQAQQTVIKEGKMRLSASHCLSAPEGNKQPAVEQAQQVLVEKEQQQFTKSTLELSTELNQEIVLQKVQDKITKDGKWLPSEQYQWLMTKKERKLKGPPGQSTPPHYEKELLEHSSHFLWSELSKAGFETSFNSSTHSILCLNKKIQQTSIVNSTVFETSCNSSSQSILRCTKKIQQKSTLNNTVLHRSYMEDSIIKRVPVITEASFSETLENYKVSNPMSPKKLYSRCGRPKRKCAIGVNYFISP